MSVSLEAPELVAGVERLAQAAPTGYQAQITLINNCPSSWGVVIVSAGVKFFYRSGADYTDGPRNVHLSSGQSATFVSNDPNQCVFQYFLAAVVTVPNEPPKTLTNQDGVGPGECVVHCSLVLGPKQSVGEATLAALGLLHRVELSKRP
ncbi:MAG: hypothetical protein IPN03_11215 [Holophagales bacterium]|nr:hypothetical protein [Holophagales bacterium]